MIVKTQELLLENIDDKIASWVADSIVDAGDLAHISDNVIANAVQIMSVPIMANEMVWPWVEHKNIKIFNRIDFSLNADASDSAISAFAENVMRAFKTGASGIQVYIKTEKIKDFSDAVRPIRDDLFFDYHFSVAIDIDEQGEIDWEKVLNSVRLMRADALLIMAPSDSFDAKSGFIGRIFGMLENWNSGLDLHLMFGKNMMRVTQTLRLVKKMHPELMQNLRVFIPQD